MDIMTEGDVDSNVGEDSILDLDTEPLRYEDYLRRHLDGDTDFSALKKEPEIMQEAAPKSKEQIISELAPKIRTPGMTSGRATIAAQDMYTEVEKQFGVDMDAVLEAFQPGQNPRQFLDGFRNAYIAGKLGDKAALENSTAAAYLSDSQRELAFELGERAGQGLEKGGNNVRITLGEAVATADKPYVIPLSRDVKKEIIRRGVTSKTTIYTNDTAQNPLATYAQRIPKMEGFYDVVMHGVDTAVWFFETKIDAYTLAQIIRQRPDYKKGTPIRLLSCNTGNTENTGDCVAQLLANELDVIVCAPTEELYVSSGGDITIGEDDCGEMRTFYSRRIRNNERYFYK